MNQPVVVTTPDELQRIIVDAVSSVTKNMTIPSVKKKLLSSKDVEREYGIKERLLENWRCQGLGPVYTNVGRNVFYERDLLEQYIASGRVKTFASGVC